MKDTEKLAKEIGRWTLWQYSLFSCSVKLSKFPQTVKSFLKTSSFFSLFKLKNKFDKHIKRPQTDQQDKRCKRMKNMEKTSLDSHGFPNWSMNDLLQTAPLSVKDPPGKGDWQTRMSRRPSPGWDLQVMCKVYDKILLDDYFVFVWFCKCSLKK